MTRVHAPPRRRPRARLRARWRLAVRGRWALPVLFAGSVVESTILPWPIEVPMLAYMMRGRRQTVDVTLVVSAGSVTGCLLAFWAGAAAFEALQTFIAARPDLQAGIEQARTRIDGLGPIVVFLAMLAPVPVQAASFAAGAAGMGTALFLIAASTGRTLRYAAMGGVVYLAGPSIRRWWAGRPAWIRRAAIPAAAVAFVILFAVTLAALF